jgi:two-component system, cell cycle response regulator
MYLSGVEKFIKECYLSMENLGDSATYLRQQLLMTQGQNLEFRNYIQALECKHNQIKGLLSRDPLTGLYSRQYLHDYLPTLKHSTDPASVAIIDIDHFKTINDSFTQLVGDEVLEVVSTLLQTLSRKTDTIVRYGIEEFVLIFTNAGIQEALVVCERFRHGIQYHNWTRLHPKLRVTASVGLASGKSSDCEILLRRAHEKIAQAKKNGWNCVKY